MAIPLFGFGYILKYFKKSKIHNFAESFMGFALLIFKPFLALIDFIVPLEPAANITTHIAMLHTVFNICATTLFVSFVNQIAEIPRKVIPETQTEKDEHYHLPAILPHSRISADLYSYQIQSEISKMSAKVMEMFDSVCNSFMNPKNAEAENDRVKFLENYIDEMNAAITDFIQKCARLPNANRNDRAHFSSLLHITDTLENLSDETCSLMHTVKKYVSGKNYKSTSKRSKEIEDYVEQVRIFFEQVCVYFTIGFTQDEKLAGISFRDALYAMLQSV